MLDIDRRLHGDERTVLVDVVGRVLGDPDVVVESCVVTPLAQGAGNPASGGIWRVSGSALSHGVSLPWSVVLKAVLCPTNVDSDHRAYSHINYWLREIDVLKSDVLSEMPTGMSTPHFFGSNLFADETAWLWLEDLGNLDRRHWSVASYIHAASRLARMQSPYLWGTPLPSEPWLNTKVQRKWVELVRPLTDVVLIPASEGYEPLWILDPNRTPNDMRTLVDFAYDIEPLLRRAESLPQTLCHNDPNIDNIALRATSDGGIDAVFFDWQWIGREGVGTDLGQLLCDLPATLDGLDRPTIEDQVLDAYRSELVSSGVAISRDEVEFGYCSSAISRHWIFSVALLGNDLGPVMADGNAAAVAARLDEFLAKTRAGRLPRLAHRAAELLR